MNVDSLMLPLGVGLPLFVICGLFGAWRAKRRGATTGDMILSGIVVGFVGAVALVTLAFAALMVMWGLSI